jgi:hypothetical protein
LRSCGPFHNLPQINKERTAMKKLIGLGAALFAGTAAHAGGLAEPVMEPDVVEAATSSSSAGIIVPLLLLLLIAAAASGGNGGGE